MAKASAQLEQEKLNLERTQIIKYVCYVLNTENYQAPTIFHRTKCWGNRREGDHWGDLGVDGWIILGCISRR